MLHLMSAVRQDLISYANAIDTMYGFPHSTHQTCYAVPFGNLAAQANPLDPAARWAMDISINQPLWDAASAPQSEWPFPVDLNALPVGDAHRVPFPASCTQWNCTYAPDPAYPGWFPVLTGP